ncbi:MAG: hypothetical protein ABUS54_00090 [Actinomycetota bacterium]
MALSKSAVDRVGERVGRVVRNGQVPTSDDLAIIEMFRAEYAALVVMVHELLSAMADVIRRAEAWIDWVDAIASEAGLSEESILSVASRPKTTGAIISKLA